MTTEDKWNAIWGWDHYAIYDDIMQELEPYYEKETKKSCVYWNSTEDNITRSTDLPRSEDYDTEGWTDEFDEWGTIKMLKACESGCENVGDVINWIKENC